MPQNVSFLQQLKRSRDVLYIVILALVVTVVWIVLSVYHSSVKTDISPEIQKLTTPLSPDIDTGLLQSLTTRTTFTLDQLSNFPINKEILNPDGTSGPAAPTGKVAATPTPSEAPTTEPTVAPEPTATPEETPAPTAEPTATPETTATPTP